MSIWHGSPAAAHDIRARQVVAPENLTCEIRCSARLRRRIFGRFRVDHDMDFLDGANDLELIDRYSKSYIPNDTLWVDASMLSGKLSERQKFELACNLYHEYREREIMDEEGLKYDKAHERANAAEKHYRQKTTLPVVLVVLPTMSGGPTLRACQVLQQDNLTCAIPCSAR
jgi:hypothetical protein